MKKRFLLLVVSLVCLLLIAGASIASAEEEKGVDQKDIEKVVKELKSIKFGLLWYLSYMNGEGKDVGGTAGDGVERNKFAVKRGYFRVTKEFMPWFEGHITLDVTQASIKDSSLSDSVQVRLKYLYGKFKLPDLAFLTKPNIEVGMVHMPWLDFEEH